MAFFEENSIWETKPKEARIFIIRRAIWRAQVERFRPIRRQGKKRKPATRDASPARLP
jgi:hypothetical protein